MKVSLEELEEGLAELKLSDEEQLSPKFCNNLDSMYLKDENKEEWTKRWGRYRKTAARSKIGVNRIDIKKPPRPNLKIKFKRIMDSSENPAKERWINIPREAKTKTEEKHWLKGGRPKEWETYYATYKEQQHPEGWND
ncbi:hypothetical protein A2U01_0024454, partial [Trifolium medium]|nr:hypothetical protein [Trifolium medium]